MKTIKDFIDFAFQNGSSYKSKFELRIMLKVYEKSLSEASSESQSVRDNEAQKELLMDFKKIFNEDLNPDGDHILTKDIDSFLKSRNND